jgi:hypothetical protein
MSAGAIKDSLLNSGTRVLTIILRAQTMVTITNVKSIELPAQESNASSIEVRSTKQKQLDDDVHISPPKKNATICGCVGTLAKKQHDSIVSKKKKRCDENLDVVAKLVACASQKNRVISTRSTLIKK